MASDKLILLPPFQWRGRAYPVTSREVSFSHEGVRHKLQYRDGELIEQTGAQALTFSYTIPMRDEIRVGPYRALFSDGLSKLLEDCINRERGVLFDPIYGEFNVVPTSYRDSSDPNKRDGTDISIEFVKSINSDEIDVLPSTVSISGVSYDSGRLDEELVASGEFSQFKAKDGSTDIFSAIAGAGAQLERSVSKVSASLDDLAFRMRKVDEQAERLENPQNIGLQNSARSVRDAAIRLKRRGDSPNQKLVTVTQRTTKTLDAVALEANMTLEELLRLNPDLVLSPSVKPGTKLMLKKPSPGDV